MSDEARKDASGRVLHDWEVSPEDQLVAVPLEDQDENAKDAKPSEPQKGPDAGSPEFTLL